MLLFHQHFHQHKTWDVLERLPVAAISRFSRGAPERLAPLPPPNHQVFPHPLRLVLVEVTPGLQERRRPIRHRSPLIHENHGVLRPGPVVPMEAVGPSGLRVHQPSLPHNSFCSSYVLFLATEELARVFQQPFGCGNSPKSRQEQGLGVPRTVFCWYSF